MRRYATFLRKLKMIKARVSWLILFIIAFPVVILFPPAIDNLIGSFQPVVREQDKEYVVCGAYDCNDYEKRIIDAPPKQGDLSYLDREHIRIKDSFERDISFAVESLV